MQKPDFTEGHVLLIDKPYEWTSFNVVSSVRYLVSRIAGVKRSKVGHAGTLDPLATGLLILCTGKATKDIEKYQAQEKEYTGTFYLGATTPGFDQEKAIDAYFPTEHITNELVIQTAESFLGHQLQVPPIFSAVKVKGKRAYDLARQEKTPELEPKSIEIRAFEITRIELPEVDFRVVCTKGTYIRSLARDFGQRMNSGAHLTALRRTRIGNFSIENAVTPEAFKAGVHELWPDVFDEKNYKPRPPHHRENVKPLKSYRTTTPDTGEKQPE